MKLSLATFATLAALVAACSSSEEAGKGPAGDTTPPAPTEDPGSAAPPRKLVEGKAMPTSPVNLLADPGFGLAGRQAGYGSFLSFYEAGYEPYEIETAIDSRSPAGFGGGVALIKPAGATDSKSERVLLLTSFLGGQGPFHAQIWISKSTVKGAPVDVPTDGSAIEVSVMDGDPDQGDAFDLKPVDSATRKIGGRTWILLRADIPKPLAHGGFFMVRTGDKGGHVHLAAPEVTTDQIVPGGAVMSRSTVLAAKARTKTGIERAAIVKYRALPPRLVPASPEPRLGL